jgi:nitric oxide dioxygenase
MYAKNIEKLENLGPLVGTIINKHVSLQIQPEHYPIVGASLLKAIREVLGAEVATDAVIEAWGAAYGQLADILIGAEESIYSRTSRPKAAGAARVISRSRRRRWRATRSPPSCWCRPTAARSWRTSRASTSA